MSELNFKRLMLYGVLFSVFLIVLRLAWTFPGIYVASFIRRHVVRGEEPWPGARSVFVVGWTGMRGVLALAAAMSLPQTAGDGSPFPHRSLIVFLTFTVILVTLVFQGLTLPPLIRALGLAGSASSVVEAQEGRKLVLEATMARLEEIRRNDPSGPVDVYDHLSDHYRQRLASFGDPCAPENITHAEHYSRYSDLSRKLLDVERQAALRLRDEGQLTDEVMREVEHGLDLNAARLMAAMERQSETAMS